MLQNNRLQGIFLLLSITCLLLMTAASSARQPDIFQLDTVKLLDEVLDDAEFAITEHNMRIIDRLHIGKSIRERGYEQFPDYEVILFCNLTFARRLLESSPEFINYCPTRITVRDDGENITITAPLLPENNDDTRANKLAATVNGILREIVEFAAEDWLKNYDAENDSANN